MKIARTSLAMLGLLVPMLMSPRRAAADSGDVKPPTVKTHVDAITKQASALDGRHVDVVLEVTVGANGHVAHVDVVTSGGTELDRAAVAAIEQWTFEPATRRGRPVAARIRVPFHFSPPAEASASAHNRSDEEQGRTEGRAGAPPSASLIGAGIAPTSTPEEVRVVGPASKPSRGASDFRVSAATLQAAPRQSAADLLTSAPGVAVARPEGDAVAPRVVLRGFDAEHGQDIEFTVSGIPLNQPSHIHGQGYADLNIVIPETVRRLRVVEGVYDPHQGDFATAGSIDFELGLAQRGALIKGTYGSFATRRMLAAWAPEGASEDTFAAAVFRESDGFGPGVRGSVSGGALGQYRFDLHNSTSLMLHVASYGARAATAGVVRRDDIDAGRVGFYDAYPDPSARSQSVGATRTQLGLTLERIAADGGRSSAGFWVAYGTYRGRQNFSGYTQRSLQNPNWMGRGDLIEQSNEDLGLGGKLSYKTRRHEPRSWLSTLGEIGTDVRFHAIDQSQNLLKAPENAIWDKRVDARIRTVDVGSFLDAEVAYKRYLKLRGGLRADLLLYDVSDSLGNFIPTNMPKSHLVGFNRTATGIAWGPRATLESDALSWLHPSLSYGEGYRSPQARQLGEGESAPFARVKSYEAGLRFYDHERVSFSAVAYLTKLSYDVAFDPVEGRLERIGPTTRQGLAGYFTANPTSWFHLATSATFVNATLDSPPIATPDNPSPPYAPNQSLPYVPPIVLRSDVTAHAPLFDLAGQRVEGRVGYGTTFLSARPLPYGQSAPPYFVLDALASLRRDPLTLSVEMFNVLDARYSDTEYAFVSNWNTTRFPSSLAERHVTAAAPRTVLFNLAVEVSP